ncbi:zinc transporter ZIP13 homolog [Anoplophora glabripennis]|uniref:zinc transporter ZIP13 homolog n=1 Tax=Anoplophora glabripennis TaxID=217634 RepID=UPI000875937B|nr:zinc transporter ZIP13 homolog [Anoplophora glabripennis]
MTVISNVFVCESNNTNIDGSYREIMQDLVPSWIFALEYMPWLWAMFGSILVGLSGVLPLLVIPIDHTDDLKQGDGANKLKTLLSFAVGGLLGDVFLHSLPEIWANDVANNGGHTTSSSGILILTGLIVFVAAEKLFTVIEKVGERQQEKNNTAENNNTKGLKEENKTSFVTGYLNLVANTIDNFTHGLSLGGAFLVSLRLGLFTTFAILVHEIPHEVGDFAILLKSGFTRWHAATFQLLTAGGGLIGALSAITFSGAKNSMEARTSWILPFTAGTFLHIALVTVLPDLLKEEDPKESLKQLFALIFGITLMACVTNAFE